ncbi:MAG: hypothetical protein GX547_16190 [Phycisphaerae bacterium]|nr:hypothetical protein [Phycisphaerae bacterium]
MPATLDLAQISVPEPARHFAAPCEFVAGDKTDAVPVHIAARTAEPLDHWYWGRCVHDLDGCNVHKERLALDYCHDDDQIVGFLDGFEHREDALWCDGQLVLTTDRAREILANHKAGVPYEASIAFDLDDGLVVEQLSQGATAQVNGRLLEGPLLIFRQWSLRGVAICPHGYDKHTHTEFCRSNPAAARFTAPAVDPAAESDDDPAETPEDEAAPDPDAENGDAAAPPATDEPTPEAQPVDQIDDQAAGDPPPADATEQRAREGAAFVAEFGETRGAAYFVRGLSLEAARAEFTRDLAAENDQLRTRLAAIGAELGDSEPAEFADGEPNQPNQTASGRSAKQLQNALPTRLASFALGLRLPGRN